ncbi:protein downstream neighbor of son homolog isoform X2 [Chelonus insularis]|nr:protein downstream neighbor of son homolog isoform X2 [Chelonus insularis]
MMSSSSSSSTSSDVPIWIHPEQVMQMHRLKMKKKALQARMKNKVGLDKPSLDITVTSPNKSNTTNKAKKRKNPFLKDESDKKFKDDDVMLMMDTSTDSVLFDLMKIQNNKQLKDKTESQSLSCFLSELDVTDKEVNNKDSLKKGTLYLPIDWTLNTKMRFMSLKPFAWNVNLKTSEQASGTTGFVRCINTGEQQTTLDTSPNARFHQCCLVWQHPSLPWIELYPRMRSTMNYNKVNSKLASDSLNLVNNQLIKDALYSEWTESFRSLFHLLRAQQCPYFYVCANTFTALFRAAGICGISEVHVLLTPTTRGFRQALKQQEIEFTMPLKIKEDQSNSFNSNTMLQMENRKNPDDDGDDDDDYDNDKDDDFSDNNENEKDDLLESLGIEGSEMKKINKTQKRSDMKKDSQIDKLKQSLIYVKGVEAQALFNFLINCKSAVAITGPLAGIPPTLLAPVAFYGATLKSLKVRESNVCIDNDKFYSLEIKGPILPHTLPSLCLLMKSSQLDQFSVSCEKVYSTKSFTDLKYGLKDSGLLDEKENDKNHQSVFSKENLSDCGLNDQLLSHFCSSDPKRIQLIESLKYSISDGYIWC